MDVYLKENKERYPLRTSTLVLEYFIKLFRTFHIIKMHSPYLVASIIFW